MSVVLNLELPDDVYEPLVRVAEKVGLPLEEWILARLRAYLPQVTPSEQERAQAMARLVRHAGAVNLGHPTGISNESIDFDLLREMFGTVLITPEVWAETVDRAPGYPNAANVTGAVTAGIFLLAHNKGIKLDVKAALDVMRSLGFRLSEGVYKDILRQVGQDGN